MMSKDATPVAESVVVTQADREAAGDYLDLKKGYSISGAIRRGMNDEGPTAQAFARHRLASYEAGRAEGVREAAEVADASADYEGPFTEYFKGRDQGCHDAATSIRALSKEPTK